MKTLHPARLFRITLLAATVGFAATVAFAQPATSTPETPQKAMPGAGMDAKPSMDVKPGRSTHHSMKPGTDPKQGMGMQHGMDMQTMMTNMNSEMMAMKPTGDADVDFAAMMRVHHQAAVTMAEAQLKNGKDAQMRVMAKDIIRAQKKEIAVFDKFLAKRGDGGMKMNSPAMPMKK